MALRNIVMCSWPVGCKKILYVNILIKTDSCGNDAIQWFCGTLGAKRYSIESALQLQELSKLIIKFQNKQTIKQAKGDVAR